VLPTEPPHKEFSMSDQSVTRDLFDRWERVWHEGQYDWSPVAWDSTTSGTTNKAIGR